MKNVYIYILNTPQPTPPPKKIPANQANFEKNKTQKNIPKQTILKSCLIIREKIIYDNLKTDKYFHIYP